MSRRTFGIAGTILVHAAVLFVLLPRVTPPPDPPPPPQEEAMEASINSGEIIDNSPAGTGSPCYETHDTYVGIGFMYDGVTHEIIRVPEHLPAAQAGIRTGDIWLDVPEPMHLGVPVIVTVKRGPFQLRFTIMPTQICRANADGL